LGPVYIYAFALLNSVYWGQEWIGADLSKHMLQSALSPKPVTVVVSDGGIRDRNLSKISLMAPKPEELPKAKPLFETMEVEGRQIPYWVNLDAQLYHPEHGSYVANIIGNADEDRPYSISQAASLIDLDIFFRHPLIAEVTFQRAIQGIEDYPEPLHILHMSHGISRLAETRKKLNDTLAAKDISCVLAAGNESFELGNSSIYGDFPHCVIVGGIDRNSLIWEASNYGEVVDLVAPSELIALSEENGAIERRSGTSFGAPMVTGVLANLRNLLPTQRSQILNEILFVTALDLGEPGYDRITGHGMVNALRAGLFAKFIKDQSASLPTENAVRELFYSAEFQNLSSQLVRQSELERAGISKESRAYEEALRLEALLDSSPARFAALSKYYAEIADSPERAAGAGMLAYNRPAIPIDSGDLEEFAERAAPFLERSFHGKNAGPAKKMLVNSDLIAAIADAFAPKETGLARELRDFLGTEGLIHESSGL